MGSGRYVHSRSKDRRRCRQCSRGTAAGDSGMVAQSHSSRKADPEKINRNKHSECYPTAFCIDQQPSAVLSVTSAKKAEREKRLRLKREIHSREAPSAKRDPTKPRDFMPSRSSTELFWLTSRGDCIQVESCLIDWTASACLLGRRSQCCYPLGYAPSFASSRASPTTAPIASSG